MSDFNLDRVERINILKTNLKQRIHILDGGMGTMLQSAGLDDGGAPVLRSVVLQLQRCWPLSHLAIST